MLNRCRRWIRKIQIKIKYFRSKFDVVIQNKIPHIKISEKHEKNVKRILRLLTIIGIVSSVIAFSTWYHSLIFSIILFLIEQLFEQIIFTQTVMFVQPLPQKWDASKWTGMIMVKNNENLVLGFGFSDKDVGLDFFNTLFAWNEDSNINTDKIQLSLIQEDKDNYSVHIYPTLQRDFIDKNFKLAEKRFDKRKNAGKQLEILITQMCFCKVFPMSDNCAYNMLKHNNKNVCVQLFDTSQVDNNNPRTYTNVSLMDDRFMLFENITVCKRNQIDKNKNATEYFNVPKY